MAFYSEEIIEEIKGSNDIVSVVSNYVNLKRRGNTYVGLCPFHREKTPSFAVQPDKQIFHCFGCGVGGNVINFIMKIENIGFKEAIEFLAEKANITLPTVDSYDLGVSQDELRQREESKNQMYEINKVAGRFFYENIEKSKVAKDYIKARKIDSKTVARFGLGFALDDNGLLKRLQSLGFKESDMLATGLIGKSEKGFLYDKFKNRFMFPIFDVRKRLIAFGGRTLESKEEMKAKGIPKYVNSPENLIYTKGKHLYGLNLAKASNNKMKRILVVEGYMDVISPHQVGITNVVASLGTALTEKQGRLLKQYADEVVLSYDSDEAGQKAIMRGIEIMQSLDVPVKVLQMNGAKDPDEFVLKYGPERFEKLIDASISPVQYKVNMLMNGVDLTETSQKISFLTKMSEILSKVNNTIERDIYVDKFSRELNVGKEAIIAEIEKRTIRNKNFNTKNWQSSRQVGTTENTYIPTYRAQESDSKEIDEAKRETEKLIIFILTTKNENVFNKLKTIYTKDDIDKFSNKLLISKLYNLYETGDIIYKELMSVCDSEEERGLLSEILVQVDTKGEETEKFVQEIIRKIEVDKLQSEKKEVIKELQKVNTEEERRLLEGKLNEIILKLAKR